MNVYIFDVGHGDSILLEFEKDTSYGIVDCNRKSTTLRRWASSIKVLSFFEKLIKRGKKPTIEFVCLSHPHYDHYNGLAAVISRLLSLRVPILEYWDFGPSAKKVKALKTLASYEDQKKQLVEFERLCRVKIRLLDRHNCKYRILSSPQKNLWIREDVSIDTVAPCGSHAEQYGNYLGLKTMKERRRYLKMFPASGDDNIICSGLLVKYGAFHLWLGADLTNMAWREILDIEDSHNPFMCHALKVSHHGSLDGNFPRPRHSTCSFLLKDEGCKVAVISGGYRTNLPHPNVVQSFRDLNARIYCTGQINSDPPVRYTPPRTADDIDVRIHLAIDEVYEISDRSEGGHGDIKLTCHTDGRCVETVENADRLPGASR